MTAQIVPLPAANQWREELVENFNNQLDKLQAINMQDYYHGYNSFW